MIINNNVFDLLQEWYLAQCNGEWENGLGISIGTIDNPGWRVRINLIGTKYEKKNFTEISNLIPDDDWIYCRVKEGIFEGFGGAKNLTDIVNIFIEWKDS